MLAVPPLEQRRIKGIGKYSLGERIPNTGNGWNKGFTMLRYAVIRQLNTIAVRRSCLTCITGMGKGRKNDGLEFR